MSESKSAANSTSNLKKRKRPEQSDVRKFLGTKPTVAKADDDLEPTNEQEEDKMDVESKDDGEDEDVFAAPKKKPAPKTDSISTKPTTGNNNKKQQAGKEASTAADETKEKKKPAQKADSTAASGTVTKPKAASAKKSSVSPAQAAAVTSPKSDKPKATVAPAKKSAPKIKEEEATEATEDPKVPSAKKSSKPLQEKLDGTDEDERREKDLVLQKPFYTRATTLTNNNKRHMLEYTEEVAGDLLNQLRAIVVELQNPVLKYLEDLMKKAQSKKVDPDTVIPIGDTDLDKLLAAISSAIYTTSKKKGRQSSSPLPSAATIKKLVTELILFTRTYHTKEEAKRLELRDKQYKAQSREHFREADGLVALTSPDGEDIIMSLAFADKSKNLNLTEVAAMINSTPSVSSSDLRGDWRLWNYNKFLSASLAIMCKKQTEIREFRTTNAEKSLPNPTIGQLEKLVEGLKEDDLSLLSTPIGILFMKHLFAGLLAVVDGKSAKKKKDEEEEEAEAEESEEDEEEEEGEEGENGDEGDNDNEEGDDESQDEKADNDADDDDEEEKEKEEKTVTKKAVPSAKKSANPPVKVKTEVKEEKAVIKEQLPAKKTQAVVIKEEKEVDDDDEGGDEAKEADAAPEEGDKEGDDETIKEEDEGANDDDEEEPATKRQKLNSGSAKKVAVKDEENNDETVADDDEE